MPVSDLGCPGLRHTCIPPVVTVTVTSEFLRAQPSVHALKIQSKWVYERVRTLERRRRREALIERDRECSAALFSLAAVRVPNFFFFTNFYLFGYHAHAVRTGPPADPNEAETIVLPSSVVPRKQRTYKVATHAHTNRPKSSLWSHHFKFSLQ